ncbi:MAG: OmpA family protein [Flavobacteriales bacterium]|nr:OmpA family protein [Flavobacteriales bacterium]
MDTRMTKGDDAKNRTLSSSAAAVEKYLEDKGVSAARVTSCLSHGETMPVDDNKTAAGRAKNFRRVEFR